MMRPAHTLRPAARDRPDRPTMAMEMEIHRARIAREESLHPFERKEAEGSVLPKIGGTRTQEQEQLD
eukprot:6014054-Prymnesium_polylepis.1